VPYNPRSMTSSEMNAARRSATVLLTFGACIIAIVGSVAQRGAVPTAWPGRQSGGATLLPNGWRIAPAGKHVQVGDLPLREGAQRCHRGDDDEPEHKLRELLPEEGGLAPDRAALVLLHPVPRVAQHDESNRRVARGLRQHREPARGVGVQRARGGRLGDHGVQRRRLAVHREHARALTGEEEESGPPDAAGRAGDDRALAAQPAHGRVS